MKILVCGGAGYIGSNMTAMLAAEGFEAVVLDNLSRGHRSAVARAELIEGDMADYDLLLNTIKDHKIEAVMHFGANIEVGESVAQPLKYYDNNFCNTRTLLVAMEEAGVDKFVFSSTAAVYGTPERIPLTEDSAQKPVNPYGETLSECVTGIAKRAS
jgi:UDP-glucose 4-epimerase